MKYVEPDLLLEKAYAYELGIYVLGWIAASFGLIRVLRNRPDFVFLGYKHQNLKVVALCLLWPFFLIVLPLVPIGFLVWSFLRSSKR